MGRNSTVYLDNNATTRLAPEALEAMLPFLRDSYGNPSSPYTLARSAALALDTARHQAAKLVGVAAENLVFTSGGTESNAMALLGSLPGQHPRNEIVISAVEHASVWGWRDRLTKQGYRVLVVPVDATGALDLSAMNSMLSDRTALVSVMVANNETGIIYPIKKIVEMAHAVGALVHTDAAQAAGKIPVNMHEIGVDFATVCGHKFHACKGIGCLYIRNASAFTPVMLGGGQEFGRRPGTEPVASVVSLGVASKLAAEWQHGRGSGDMAARRDDLETRLENVIPELLVVGRSEPRLPNTSLLLIRGVETEPLLALLDMEGIACSSGSACASGAHEPSHVLQAMGLADSATAVLRISASRFTESADYEKLLDVLPPMVQRLRAG